MAKTQGPKILQKIESLYIEIIPILKRYPKAEKYTLAEKTENFFLDAIEEIYWSTYNRIDRSIHLSNARIKFQMVGFHLRVARRMGFVSEGLYEKISIEIVEIGKMISGWIKSVDRDENRAENV